MAGRSSLLCLFFLAACASLAPSPAPGGPPNVVLVIADDHGYADLGCAGLAGDVETPSLDRLAASGVRFTQAYAASPICNPSRAALLTGCYPQRFGTFWYGGKGIHDPRFVTLAEVLAGCGYRNAFVGKFHYGGDVHFPGNRNFPLEHGFHELYGFSGGRKHYLVHRAAEEARFHAVKAEHDREGQSLRMGSFWIDGEEVDQEGFSTELLGERAREFLRENRERPFFFVLSFNAVHNFTHQLPEAFLRERGLRGGRDWDPAREEYLDWYRQGRRPNEPEGRAHYLGQLHYLDREVGRVLDALEETGLSRRTIVIYVGDNGGETPNYADNGPLRGGKYTLYEGGIRVPLLVSWPGRFPPGVVRENVVSAMDLFPTIARAAGAQVPPHLDGIDLGPLLRGEDPDLGHETLVWDTGPEAAVRKGPWKWRTASSDDHATYEGVELEVGEFLADLERDPGETTNLAGERPEVVEELRAIHGAWRSKLDEPSPSSSIP
jgi:arylsulfatase A-like enzyme